MSTTLDDTFTNEQQLLRRATEEAFEIHFGQLTKQALPYISHPFSVLQYVADWGVQDSSIRIAAVLHEAFLPSTTKQKCFQSVANEYGKRIALIVQQCTFVFDPAGLSLNEDPESKAAINRWRSHQLQQHYKTFLDPEIDLGALIIKTADCITTTTDILSINPAQAVKHFNFYKNVWCAVKSRHEEFKQAEEDGWLGEGVWARMRYHITELKEKTCG